MSDMKTPIKGIPFNLIPTLDLYIGKDSYPPYELEAFPLTVEGAEGHFAVQISNEGVHVAVFFGSERWGEQTETPVVIGDTRYSMSFRCPPVALSEFDLSMSAETMGDFHMTNLDVRQKTLGSFYGTSVPGSDPVHIAAKTRYLPAVVSSVRDLAGRYPTFSDGFREAVSTLEIKRLREEQDDAWLRMLGRTEEIRAYMKMVPEEAGKLAPEPAWTLPCEEAAKRVVGFKVEPARMKGVGIAKLEIHSSILGSLVTVDLIDGTSEAHSLSDDE